MLELFLLPPGGPLCLALLGLLLRLRRPRLGSALITTGLLAAWLLSTPQMAATLNRALAPPPVLSDEAIRESGAEAIVVLAGGLSVRAPEYGPVDLNAITLARLRYGARLQRLTGLPVLVSGGYRDHGREPSEAARMAAVLSEEYGVREVWTEDRSQNTRENAAYSAPMLAAQGVQRVLLVSHAAHLPRALEAFARAGVDAVPAPTQSFLWTPPPGVEATAEAADWLPQAGAAWEAWYASHELLGRLWYRLRAALTPALEAAPSAT